MTENKKPRGRPPKPPGEKGRPVKVYMAADVEAWLRAQPQGMAKSIAQLVRAAKV